MSIVSYAVGLGPGAAVAAIATIVQDAQRLQTWYHENQEVIGSAQHVVVSGANAISESITELVNRFPRGGSGPRLRGSLANIPASAAITPQVKRTRSSAISPFLKARRRRPRIALTYVFPRRTYPSRRRRRYRRRF